MMNETRFEKYLTSQGWTPHHYDVKKNEYRKPKGYYSTIGDLRLDWFPPGETPAREKMHITTGLNEHRHPPTLIHPRPIEVVYSVNGEILCVATGHNTTDEHMDRAFEKWKDEEILDAILTGKKLTYQWDKEPQE